ncbi:MAG: DUF4386 domain-containing protein, partial [Deltaproteobacteria bacterium]|nr:DUF4386 domain-containing protein [Deltaproteobacteria bacterium]
MNTYRKTATIVGVLYIIGTVTGVLSVVFTGSILDEPDYLVNVSANANQVILGALFVLIMGLALAMVPVVMFPVSKKHDETLALGYVVFRGALETVTYVAVVISSLLLVTLSREFVTAGAPDASHFQAVGTLLIEAGDWISQITTIVFILGALMLYYVLYRSKLVPRWISGWGLITAIPYLAAGFFVMFGLISHFSTIDAVLRLPLGLQEMVMAVWLIVKGFNP